MTITHAITFLAILAALTYILACGLPETMRAIALILLRWSTRLDAWRAKQDAENRAALAEVMR